MYHFIVNKVSGNGRGLAIWKDVEKILAHKQLNYRVFFTSYPLHATEISKEIKNGVIIVIGGDGTIHEVINGLKTSKNIPMGIIAAGSGNDFARALNIPMNTVEAFESILAGTERTVDIGRIGDKSCATVIGIGFDGKVAQTVNASKTKKWMRFLRLGRMSYIISVFKVLFNYKPANISIKIDDQTEEMTDVWLVAVANFPYYAGGMAICPNANGNDGYFELCVVHGMSKLQFIRTFPGVFKGKHISHPSIKMLTGKQIEISSSSAMIVHGDGEIIGQTPIKINIEEKALRVMGTSPPKSKILMELPFS
ncbi:diacylglycerol kinase family lipid kinase [Salicibibacter cibarius]|uniref:Diacylglycerol kinase family lipid kinase n=1 Tax=Salicibibacter cibarius TaxID=2743000 RepID=A0A7T7CBM6_9BACI|nr:diacylglycerol kinase family protein [Salicibibacter cibarius]QQK76082.1 diacylglycerol kinase family lipid kinase [Salicibibacter cibarius]